MNRKRKLLEISSDNSYFHAGHKQIKQEFPKWNCAGNDSHLDSSKDQSALKKEKIETNQNILPQSKNLSHCHVTPDRLEEHWKHGGILGMRYFIDDSNIKFSHDQNISNVEHKISSENMLPQNDHLSHGQVQLSHDEHWDHGLQGMSCIPNNQLATVTPDPNNRKKNKKNITKELFSMNNTSSQDLHRKIFINGNLIGIVRNKDGIKQECGIESNFQKGFNAYQAVKESPTISNKNILPLIEILSKNLYRKIIVSENFISIARNVSSKKTKKRCRKNKYSWKNPNLKAQKSISQKSSIASENAENSSYKISNENQFVNNITEKDQTHATHGNIKLKNDSNFKISEGQTNQDGRTSDGKKIVFPSDSIEKSLYRKIFFIGDFIGIVRNNHNEAQGNNFPGRKYVRNVRNSSFQGEFKTHGIQNAGPMIEEASSKGLLSKSKEQNRLCDNQELAFRAIGYVKTEPKTKVSQEPTQIEADELSSENLLPLIKILSQNLYQKITVGKNFIKILESQQGGKKMAGFNVKGFVKYFNRKWHGRNRSYTSHLMKNTKQFEDIGAHVDQLPSSKTLSFKNKIQNSPMNHSNYGSNRISYTRKGPNQQRVQVRKPNVAMFPVIDNPMPNQANRNDINMRKRLIPRRTRSPKNGHHTFTQNQIFQETERIRPSLKVELLDSKIMYRRSVQIREEKLLNLGLMTNRHRNDSYFGITRDQITRYREGSSTNKATVSLSHGLTNNRNVILKEGDYWNDSLHTMNYLRNELHSIIYQDQIFREVASNTISKAILSLSDGLRNNQQVGYGQEEYWNDGLIGMCPQNDLYFP